MPVLAAAAGALELPPELLMIPAAIACSCAFCLPVVNTTQLNCVCLRASHHQNDGARRHGIERDHGGTHGRHCDVVCVNTIADSG